jgi:hypothetical protein
MNCSLPGIAWLSNKLPKDFWKNVPRQRSVLGIGFSQNREFSTGDRSRKWRKKSLTSEIVDEIPCEKKRTKFETYRSWGKSAVNIEQSYRIPIRSMRRWKVARFFSAHCWVWLISAIELCLKMTVWSFLRFWDRNWGYAQPELFGEHDHFLNGLDWVRNETHSFCNDDKAFDRKSVYIMTLPLTNSFLSCYWPRI